MNKLVSKLRFQEFIGEWEEKKFSSYIKLYRGSSPRPIQEYLTKNKPNVNWIKIGDTKKSINFTINKVEEKITLLGAKKSRKVEVGELILANSMSFGKTYLLQIEGCIYDGWFVLREYEEYFYKPFLLQLLNSEYMQQQYKKLSAGGIVQNISSDIVNSTMLFCTSLKEQQKIASCLSSLDNLIQSQSTKIKALKKYKKGLMQQLFPSEGEKEPKLRFKEFSEEWEEKKLGSVFKFVRGPFGGALKKEIFLNDGYAVYEQYSAIYNDFNKIRYFISAEKFKELKRFSLQENDIIMSCSGTMGKFAIAPKWIKKGVINQALLKLTLNIKNDVLFLKQILELPINQGRLLSQSGEGAIKNVAPVNQIKETTVYLPSLPEQQKIASCISSLDSLIQAQTQKVESLKKHKKALMQQLFVNSTNELAK